MRKMVSIDAIREVLTVQNVGEGVHTAFRKCDYVTDMTVWNAIQDMPNDQWRAVIGWVTEALMYQIECVSEETE